MIILIIMNFYFHVLEAHFVRMGGGSADTIGPPQQVGGYLVICIYLQAKIKK